MDSMRKTVVIRVATADVLAFECDALILKYAQARFGADAAVGQVLQSHGVRDRDISPHDGDVSVVSTSGIIGSTYAVFVGTPPLYQLDYRGIEKLVQQGIRTVAQQLPLARHVALTLHGAGFGLDEAEATRATLSGIASELLASGDQCSLDRITIVERNGKRVERIFSIFEKYAPTLGLSLDQHERAWLVIPPEGKTQSFQSMISPPPQPPHGQNPHAFIAMPFSREFEDVYHYGIEKPLHDAGLLSERVDQQIFTGDVLDHIKTRIRSARFVVADLSGANANVYLEVGFAWGNSIPTILLARSDEKLLFDVQGHRCLMYDGIKQLEQMLSREIEYLGKLAT